MSQNVEIARRMVDAFNRRDADALLSDADPDFVMDWSRSVGPEPDVFSGHEEVRRFLEAWWEAFEETLIEPDDVIDAGGQVVTVFHGRIRGKRSGAQLVGAGAVFVASFRDGKAIRLTLYQSRAEALDALATRE
jgi:ketosteroid isomerase-like protein